jgi:hypothetical protein
MEGRCHSEKVTMSGDWFSSRMFVDQMALLPISMRGPTELNHSASQIHFLDRLQNNPLVSGGQRADVGKISRPEMSLC